MPKLKKISSLTELAHKAKTDPAYAALALDASENLGGSRRSVDEAIRWLNITASETDEDGVVDEINFLIR